MVKAPAGSLPLLVTALVNRMGTIGLTLIPALLVQHQLSATTSSWIMTTSRIGMILGTLFSGWIVDQKGPKQTLLWALILSSIGLFALPLVTQAPLLAFFALVAQGGNAMYPSSMRLLLVRLVDGESQQKVALGWVRMVNNLGQVVSYGIGALAGGWGLIPLFWLDSATGIISAKYAAAKIPAKAENLVTQVNGPVLWWDPTSLFRQSIRSQQERLKTALGLGALGMGFSFFYDLFMISSAARLSQELGPDGVSWFSLTMLTNTALCALLAVKATRIFIYPERVIPLAVFFAFLANWICFGTIPDCSQGMLYSTFIAILVLTGAELAFFATSTFALLQWIPKSPYQGRIHSLLVLLQVTGRLIAASISFPVILQGDQTLVRITLTSILTLMAAITLWVYPRVKRGVPTIKHPDLS